MADDASAVDVDAEEDRGYTYTLSEANYDEETEERYLGFSFNHSTVGVSSTTDVSFEREDSFVPYFDITDLREGNLVTLSFHTAYDKEPFYVLFARVGDSREATGHSALDHFDRPKFRSYLILLESVSSDKRLLIGGKLKVNPVTMPVDVTMYLPSDANPEKVESVVDDLIADDSITDVHKVLHHMEFGEVAENGNASLRVPTDPSIARRFEINAPVLFVSDV